MPKVERLNGTYQDCRFDHASIKNKQQIAKNIARGAIERIKPLIAIPFLVEDPRPMAEKTIPNTGVKNILEHID
ncbi:hypothetical protein [Ktedonobacter racemifer]|uniref:hypothetical protein n=1 Tax=Ktedonobacter racemifer TaxID=363277 RepID=UPI00058DB235|nr:hypothetical protein [Ktedonobacter racemifer]